MERMLTEQKAVREYSWIVSEQLFAYQILYDRAIEEAYQRFNRELMEDKQRAEAYEEQEDWRRLFTYYDDYMNGEDVIQ